MKLLLAMLVGVSALVVPQAQAGLRVIVIDGDEAANIVAERIAAQPVIEVRDREDRKVTGAVVRFFIRRTVRNRLAALFSNGQSEATTLTDSVGRAQASAISPLEPGSFQIDVEVSHQGQTARASIRHTNYATTADAQSAGSQPAQNAAGGAGAATSSVAAAAGGGLSKLAIVGIVAGGAAGVGAAAVLARKESATPPASVSAVAVSQTGGVQGASEFRFSVEAMNFDQASLSYLWEFGDGTTSTEAAPAHVYNIAGTFTVVVTVTDARQSLRSEIQVGIATLTGAWLSTSGRYELQLNQTASTVTGSATVQSGPTTPPWSGCVLTGSVQRDPAGGPVTILLFQPMCSHAFLGPLAPLEYRLSMIIGGLRLNGTLTNITGTASPIELNRQ